MDMLMEEGNTICSSLLCGGGIMRYFMPLPRGGEGHYLPLHTCYGHREDVHARF